MRLKYYYLNAPSRYLSKFSLIIWIICSLFSKSVIFGQATSIEWSNALGGPDYEFAKDVIQSNDGGLLVVANSGAIGGDVTDFYGGAVDIWLTKLDSLGNLVWQKNYGGSNIEESRAGVATNDDGFIIAGWTASSDIDVSYNHGLMDFWIFKIDELGNLEWEQTYGGSNVDRASSIVNTSDGNFIIAGYTFSNNGDVTTHHGTNETSDYWIIKIDNLGNIIWEKSYGSTEDDYGYSVSELLSGDILVGGIAQWGDGDVFGFHGAEGVGDAWIIDLDINGELEWSKAFGGTGDEELFDVYQAIDTTIRCIGSTRSFDGDIVDHKGSPTDFYLNDCMYLKLDTLGNLLLEKCFGGTSDDFGTSIASTFDGGEILACNSASNDEDVVGHHGTNTADYWIVKIDSIQAIEWSISIGGSQFDDTYSIIQTTDSGFVAVGLSNSIDGDVIDHYPGPSNWDSWVVKLNKTCPGIWYYADTDTDGYGDALHAQLFCSDMVGYVLDSTDCNDAEINVFPGATETCNIIDDNCNGAIDEGLPIYTLYADLDADGFGNDTISVTSCLDSIVGYISDSTDCYDLDALIYPGALEICNYMDDDCDGLADDNISYIHAYQDADNDTYGNSEIDSLACELPFGYVEDSTDCNDLNPNIYPGAPEILNGLDDDCDGQSDEGLSNINNQVIQLSIHPIPATDHIIIDYPTITPTTLNIYSSSGAIIYQNPHWTGQAIDISNFPPAMYYLQLLQPEQVGYGCFVKE